MAITKERKRQLVEKYRALVQGSQAHILTSYSGVTVGDLEGLRRRLRESGGEFHIVKNSLIKRVLDEAGMALPEGGLDGTTAIGFATDDIPGVAKAIVDLAKAGNLLQVKGAIIEGQPYSAAQVMELAELPPMPVVQARLIGLLQAPASRVASALAGSVRQVLNVVHAYAEAGPSAA